MNKAKDQKRVGIYSGTFDPVHKGHIDFALSAIEKSNLDMVVFMPETLPRYKPGVTHVSHRVAMINKAIKPYPKLCVELLPDKRFTVATSLPRIKKLYPDSEILMLVGNDVLSHMSVWPLVRELLSAVGIVVAVRGDKNERHAFDLLSKLPVQPIEAHVITGKHKHIESREIRKNLMLNKTSEGLLSSVAGYTGKHWLYKSLGKK